MNNKNVQIISIEGNIGSGKSTVVNSLKEYYTGKSDESNESNESNGSNDIYFLEEPVSEWVQIQDSSGKNIIEKFYENQERYSFSFQMMAYISRLAMLKRAIKECEEKGIHIIICERSLQTDKNVFCKMLYDSNKIEQVEFQIYNKWFTEFISEIPPIHFLYIQTEPKIAYERVLKRNRKGESIALEYLEMCSKYHDNWLNDNGNVIINGNENYDKVLMEVKHFTNSIFK